VVKITEGLGASVEVHEEIFARMNNGELTYPEAKEQLIALWQETSNANKTYMSEMFQGWRLKADAQEIIDYLKGNYRLCLMSGAVDLYVQIVAEKLGVIDWFANTELAWDEEGNLVDFHYYRKQADKKLEQFETYVAENNLDRDRCAIVGDGDSDIALFRILYGIAVNKESHPELEKLARKTIQNLTQLREIF